MIDLNNIEFDKLTNDFDQLSQRKDELEKKLKSNKTLIKELKDKCMDYQIHLQSMQKQLEKSDEEIYKQRDENARLTEMLERATNEALSILEKFNKSKELMNQVGSICLGDFYICGLITVLKQKEEVIELLDKLKDENRPEYQDFQEFRNLLIPYSNNNSLYTEEKVDSLVKVQIQAYNMTKKGEN